MPNTVHVYQASVCYLATTCGSRMSNDTQNTLTHTVNPSTAARYIHLNCNLLSCSYAHLKRCPPKIPFLGSQLVSPQLNLLLLMLLCLHWCLMHFFLSQQISLNLSNNRLTSLPDDIGCLGNLEELFLQYNCLTELPVRRFTVTPWLCVNVL